MSFMDVLRAKAVTLCFLGLGTLLLSVVLLAAGLNLPLLLLGLLFTALIIGLWLMCEFLKYRLYFARLEKQLDALPEKYLLGELIKQPRDPVERYYYEIMHTVSHAAIGAVEEARRETEHYQSYVEQWIHELKTPLTACSLILANGGDPRKLKREIKRADNLTESILYYARLRSAEKDRMIAPVQGSAIIGEAVKSQMELLTAANISVEISGDCRVNTDGKALCFILKQLLVNCAKYCPGCSVKILAQPGRIELRDNGPGIPKAELSRVCDRGFTGTNGRKLGNSTGMGLFLVKELCGQLGIELEIDSGENEYTRIALGFAG